MPSKTHLKILILSSDNAYAEKVHMLIQQNQNGYDCCIDIVDQIDFKIKKADLIFVDSFEVDFSQIFSSLKETAEVVLCTTNRDVNGIPPSFIKQFSEVFMKPINEQLYEARTQYLFERIVKNRGIYLDKTWLDTLINSIPEMIWFKDVKGEHLKVNDHFCKVVGKEKSDIEGRGHYYIWDITPEEYSQGEFICLESEEVVMEAKETRIFDETVKDKNGMLRLKTYKAPVFGEEGEIIGTLGYAQDVTALSRQTFVVEHLIDSLPVPILLLDQDSNIKKANARYEEVFQSACSVDDIIGGALEDWLDDYWEILDYSDNLRNMTASIKIDKQDREFTLLLTNIDNEFGEGGGNFLVCLERVTQK